MKELFYALPGGMASGWADWGLTPAHMAYRVEPGPRLAGVRLGPEVRGGAMLLSGGPIPEGDPLPCCRQVLGECRRRGFRQVLCDFEGPPEGGLARLAAALGEVCPKNGLALHLPEGFAPAAPGCRVLVSSALLTGTLARRLADAAARFGPERLTLAVDAGAMDQLLPPGRGGTPLEPERLRVLLARLEPAVCFDRGLCAHYFTYMAQGGQAHLVMFNSPRSVRAKLDAAEALSLPAALLAAPETEGWLAEIFGG